MLATRPLARKALAAASANANRPTTARCVAVLRRVTPLDDDDEIPQCTTDNVRIAASTNVPDLWRTVFGGKSSSPPSYVDAPNDEDVFTTSIEIKATSTTTVDDVAQEPEVDMWGTMSGPKNINSLDQGSLHQEDEPRNDKPMDLWGAVFGAKLPDCIRDDTPVDEASMSDVSSPSPAPLKAHTDVWTSVFGNRDV
ncbi:hypothetical protein H310_00487 [Aphanomyces invadans]|uniref:Uncharacterized protein n=1 Tax=Aphanomyces invadans TaxID=157072 RepID=A0A024UW04_9STRA|nr:hypothetical protein H310_00487 [Aphanomyces invadans]ETW10112.1 hypothetical protein H310_00487 [Aphanomyces invadans]|eukprot:XP_008861523.1 hypothetical protein H310_00487 [Aphanomyces invadans]